MIEATAHSRATSRPTWRPTFRNVIKRDPSLWLTGSPLRSDDFTTLGAGARVHGRTLPGGGGTWVADAQWIGAGDGSVLSTASGKAVKGNIQHGNCNVRVLFHPGDTGNNQIGVFCRDVQSTAYPRYGFLLGTYTENATPPPAQAIALYRLDNYVMTRLGAGFYEAVIFRDWNVLELRCVGATITGWLNGDKIIEVVDSAYSTGRSRWGFCQTNRSNDGLRVSYVDFAIP